MFEISRDTILTTERHAKFLRTPSTKYSIRLGLDRTLSLTKFMVAARDFVANPENKALGLAGPQVGSKIAWFVMNCVDGSTRIIVNPVIIGRSGHKQYSEGCFSEPDCDERVKRSRSIVVSFKEVVPDVDGTAWLTKQETLEGRDAQVFQHEEEHLRGVLICDKRQTKNKAKNWF